MNDYQLYIENTVKQNTVSSFETKDPVLYVRETRFTRRSVTLPSYPDMKSFHESILSTRNTILLIENVFRGTFL